MESSTLEMKLTTWDPHVEHCSIHVSSIQGPSIVFLIRGRAARQPPASLPSLPGLLPWLQTHRSSHRSHHRRTLLTRLGLARLSHSSKLHSNSSSLAVKRVLKAAGVRVQRSWDCCSEHLTAGSKETNVCSGLIKRFFCGHHSPILLSHECGNELISA